MGTIQQGLNFVVYGIVLIVTVNFIPGGIISLLSPILLKKKKMARDLSNATEAI